MNVSVIIFVVSTLFLMTLHPGVKARPVRKKIGRGGRGRGGGRGGGSTAKHVRGGEKEEGEEDGGSVAKDDRGGKKKRRRMRRW
jgi:hypothetical protein